MKPIRLAVICVSVRDARSQRAVSHDRGTAAAWLTVAWLVIYKYPCPLANDYNISPPNRLLCISKMLGKLVHLGIDAMLLSAFLAGIKRSTGLTCVSLSHFQTPHSLLHPVSICELTYPLAPCDTTECRPALTQVPNKDVRRE